MHKQRLIVCIDGTWNTPTMEDNGVPVPTNVYRIYNAIEKTGHSKVSQHAYYHPGVGTDGGFFDRLSGGVKGKGLNRIIISAYKWLCDNWKSPDDEIYLFGFSRGAFAVRSLGGGYPRMRPYESCTISRRKR